jgi:hypothetical protein
LEHIDTKNERKKKEQECYAELAVVSGKPNFFQNGATVQSKLSSERGQNGVLGCRNISRGQTIPFSISTHYYRFIIAISNLSNTVKVADILSARVGLKTTSRKFYTIPQQTYCFPSKLQLTVELTRYALLVAFSY